LGGGFSEIVLGDTGRAGEVAYALVRLLSQSMSEEQLKAFLKAVQNDESLAQRLKDLLDPEAVVVIAKEAGFVISAEDLRRLKDETKLSDDELAGFAGGTAYGVRNLNALKWLNFLDW
jgi:predicted ribosomally synthesized peptide with nif11-like leader